MPACGTFLIQGEVEFKEYKPSVDSRGNQREGSRSMNVYVRGGKFSYKPSDEEWFKWSGLHGHEVEIEGSLSVKNTVAQGNDMSYVKGNFEIDVVYSINQVGAPAKSKG